MLNQINSQFIQAATDNDVHKINELAWLGAIINIEDLGGRTPMNWAAEMEHLEVVNTLAQRGADINAVDNDRSSPISWAVVKGNLDIFNIFFEMRKHTNIKLHGKKCF